MMVVKDNKGRRGYFGYHFCCNLYDWNVADWVLGV
jgi:hypothetical protein